MVNIMVSIDVDEVTKNFLITYKALYGSYKNGLRKIVQENLDLRSEVARLKVEIKQFTFDSKEDHDKIVEIALNLSKQPVYVPAMGNITQQTNISIPTSSPLPDLSAKATGFVKELNEKFKNGLIKPSEIMAMEYLEPSQDDVKLITDYPKHLNLPKT